MQRRWQQRGWLVAALMLGACGADVGTDQQASTESDPDTVSGLSLPLTSVDSQGRSYRLRDATFTIAQDYYWPYYDGGALPPPIELSTETDPDADRLSVRLLPGYYRVTLGGDWYLEREGEPVEQSVLLSDPVQWAYVSNGWYYDLDFRFGVDGTLIDFRHGDLNIDISIELPGDDSNGYDAGEHGYDAGGPVIVVDGGVGHAIDAGSVTF